MRPLCGVRVGGDRPLMTRLLGPILAAVLFVALLLPGFATASRTSEKNISTASLSSPLRIVYNANNPPLKFQDRGGRAAGLLLDLWRLWAQKNKIEIEFVAAPWDKTLEMLESGEADIHAGLFYSVERDRFLDFSQPIFNLDYKVFVHSSIQGVNNFSDLKSFSIGVPKGFTQKFIQEKLPQNVLAVYDDFPALYRAALVDEVRVFVSPLFNFNDFLQRAGVAAPHRFEPAFVAYDRDYRGAVRDGNIHLRNLIDAGMALITPAERAVIEHQWLQPKAEPLTADTLLIAISDDYQPLSFLDLEGKPAGFLIDLWQLWSEKTGIKIAFLSGNRQESLRTVKSGKAKIHSGLFKTAERAQWLLFSKPFYGIVSKFYFLADGPDFETMADLIGHRVGVCKETWQAAQVIDYDPEIEVVQFNTTQDLISALRQGLVDVVYEELLCMEDLLDRQRRQGEIHGSRKPIAMEELFAGVEFGNEELLQKVNNGLALISKDEWLEIENHWIKESSARYYEGQEEVKKISLSEEERAWRALHESISVGIDAAWPPIDFIDKGGVHRGITADYLRLLSAYCGLKFKPDPVSSWAAMLEQAKDRKLDIVATLAWTPERTKFWQYSEPYYSAPYIIVTRKDVIGINGVDDLNGNCVAIEKGYKLQGRLKRKYPDITLLPVTSSLKALEAVSRNRADAYIGNQAVALWLIEQNSLSNLLVAADSGFESNKIHIGVRPDWPELTSILNKGFALISYQQHRAIRRKWLGLADPDQQTPALVLTTAEQKWLEEHSKVRLGVDPEFVPFEFINEDGVYSGIAADYIKILNQRIGLNMEVLPDLSWSEAVAKSKKREIDVLPCVGKTIERLSLLNFSIPYIKFQRVVITRTDYPFVAGLEDLHGAKVAVQANTSHEGFLHDYTDIKASSFATLEETLTAVSSGKADAMIGNIASASHWIRRLNLTNLKVAAPAQLKTLDLHFAVRKDWPELLSIINKGLDSISHQEKNRIFRKWISIKYEPGIAPRTVIKYILQIVAGALLIFVLFFYWNRRLAGLNRQLAAARSEADRANRFKSEFLANMSHEIRTPMNAIMGLTHLALQTNLLPKQREYLTKVESSSHDLLNVINDILDFSKVEAGKLNIEEISFQLNDVLDNLAGLIALKAQKKGLEFLLKVAPDVPFSLLGDPLRLGQVLINLTDNAIKFTENGEIIISIAVAVEEEKRVCLLFAVSDSGIGLSREQQEHLFQAFTQADGSITRRYGGTGLGLAICRQLVGLMGGEIGIESELGQGSTFSFKVWLTKAPFQPPTLLQPDADLRGMRVLVVDDSEMACDVLREDLESFTFQVTTVNSGFAALEELEKGVRSEHPYKMVFMDWKMEGIDGIETSKRIRQRGYPELATIIMVTAYGREEVMLQAEQIGLDGFLIKPVNRSLLFDAIMTALGRKKMVSGAALLQKQIKNVDYQLTGQHVLLVEDNEINRQVGRELLEKVGVKVSEAVNGREAVNAVRQTEFAAVLMDLQMPEMDGITATREIRKTNPDIPIIATTAHAMVEERERCLAAGMNDHVSKPIDPQKLYAALGRWLGKPEAVAVAVAPENLFAQESDAFPNLDGLDCERALKMVDGNRPLLIKLFGKFGKNHGRADVEISTALQQGDNVLAHRLAHTVAGVAGTIGAYDLERVSRALLKAIKSEEKAEIEILLRDFSQELARVIASLSSFKIEDEPISSSGVSINEQDLNFLRQRLRELEAPLKKRRPKECKEIMAEIGELVWPASLADELDELSKFIDKYRFKEAETMLLKLLQRPI